MITLQGRQETLPSSWPMLLLVELALLAYLRGAAADCSHEMNNVDPPDAADGDVVVGNYTKLTDGKPVMHGVRLDKMKLYYYENFNVTTMNQPDRHRKLIISLEPCEGVVFIFVRKTRRCWPDPFSCCRPIPGSLAYTAGNGAPSSPPCNPKQHLTQCAWTHFHSVIDGSRNAAPTFFEVPLSATKYFISVYAPSAANMENNVEKPKYRLMVLADIGAYPRPGLQGRIRAAHTNELTVQLSWEPAVFVPNGVSDLKSYHVFSTLLLAQDEAQNQAVFLSPSKVMNSVCGLERNAVQYGVPMGQASCADGICKANVEGIVPRRRYMFNLVAESYRGYNSTYSGVIVTTDWKETTTLFTPRALSIIGAILGTLFGVVLISYLWIVKLYS